MFINQKNGESVAVFYNPYCFSHDNVANSAHGWSSSYINIYVLPYMCADFIYDLNGKKGPNRMGDDIWYMTLMYSDKLELSYIDPNLLGKYSSDVSSYKKAVSFCESSNSRLPTLEEGIAQNVNRYINGVGFGYLKNDGTVQLGPGRNWGYYIVSGDILLQYSGSGISVRCIKRGRK